MLTARHQRVITQCSSVQARPTPPNYPCSYVGFVCFFCNRILLHRKTVCTLNLLDVHELVACSENVSDDAYYCLRRNHDLLKELRADQGMYGPLIHRDGHIKKQLQRQR